MASGWTTCQTPLPSRSTASSMTASSTPAISAPLPRTPATAASSSARRCSSKVVMKALTPLKLVRLLLALTVLVFAYMYFASERGQDAFWSKGLSLAAGVMFLSSAWQQRSSATRLMLAIYVFAGLMQLLIFGLKV